MAFILLVRLTGGYGSLVKLLGEPNSGGAGAARGKKGQNFISVLKIQHKQYQVS